MKILWVLILICLVPLSTALINNPNLPKISANTPVVTTSIVNNNTLNVNNSNCWQGDCGGFRNPFNQNLNTTNSPSFMGGTFNGQLNSDVPAGLGVWHVYTVLGGLAEIGRVTSALGVFQIRSSPGYDIYFSNGLTTGLFSVTNAGATFARSALNFYVDNAAAIKSFESNISGTTIYNQFVTTGNNNTFMGNVNITGNTTTKDILANGNITSLGNITTTGYFRGNGSLLTVNNTLCFVGVCGINNLASEFNSFFLPLAGGFMTGTISSSASASGSGLDSYTVNDGNTDILHIGMSLDGINPVIKSANGFANKISDESERTTTFWDTNVIMSDVNGAYTFNISGVTYLYIDGSTTTISNNILGTGSLAVSSLSNLKGGTNTTEINATKGRVFAGNTTVQARLGGTIFDEFNNRTNSGTTETMIGNYTIPANMLSKNGDKVKVWWAGNFLGATTASKQIKIYGNSTTLFDSGSITLSALGDWRVEGIVMRINSTMVRTYFALNTAGASTSTYTKQTDISTMNFGTALLINLTGTSSGVGAGSGDIANKMGSGEWLNGN